jgi:hypothetical protein
LTWRTWIGAAAALLVLGTGTASAGLPLRLDQSQWQAYQHANAAFQRQTPKSIARFRFCVAKSAGLSDQAMATCFGKAADLELTATKALSTQLRKFARKTARPCSSALDAYRYALFGWQSVIAGVQRSVHDVGNASTVVTQARHANLVYPQVTKGAAAFAAACKPRA